MARGFRYEDPRCGREHFDRRAGIEWEFGPYANETAYSIPDAPWNRYKRTLEPAKPRVVLERIFGGSSLGDGRCPWGLDGVTACLGVRSKPKQICFQHSH